ncbi:hypothetical protein ACQCSU_19585 [Pseudarthrobacter sp. O4]|uniref:hypothetical protein n=1 Tax=Pseudarthrobacter sp. O4 TaxID=3418417 RepID=UPI003CEB1B62
MNRQPVRDQTWEGIRAEFTLPALGQVRRRLSELMDYPEPVMRQLVRVFIDDGTFCPGFPGLFGGAPDAARRFPRPSVFKQRRGLAASYDNVVLTYRNGVVLRAFTI